jgi:excisionase family DNA binding protein
MAATVVKRWLNKKEAAEYLGLSEMTLRREMAEGRLPYHKFGDAQSAPVKFDVGDLDAWWKAKRVERAPKGAD